MPGYPGDPIIRFESHSAVAEGGFAVTQLTLGTHTGTHLDAPAHVIEGGVGVDALDLAALVGPAQVIDASFRGAGEEILAEDLGGSLPEGGRILLRTDWDRRYGEREYYQRFPRLSPGAVGRLVATRTRLLGLETPSVNPELELDLHRRLLGSGIIVVEGLVGLRRLPSDVWLVALPLPLQGLDGSPCRVLALPGVSWA
jgi:arylformamidase